jgi:16S rRNA (guanine527-N7)-methyltransferase
LDLGSGGGLPGLVLLDKWDNFGVLLDSMQKRVALLREVLTWPGAPAHGIAVLGRAEEAAREAEFEGTFDLVTSRAFGPPSVTAECAVRFLKVGGLLLVSEPPESDSSKRWESPVLRTLGLSSLGFFRFETGYQVLEKTEKTPKIYPRTNGMPRKTPLF